MPATSPDIQIPVGSGGSVQDPSLAADGSGTIWGAWFNSSGTATMGYWADKISAGASGLRKAPGSGGKNLGNNQPLQPVALATRAGGGEYLAYCVPTKTVGCGHIALWRVGAPRALTVPGSGGGGGSRVAIAAAPGGHLWVLWFNDRTNLIEAVRTSAAATAFGHVLTIAAPPHLFAFQTLEAEGSKGPLDIVALATPTGASVAAAWYDTQILPPLTLHAKTRVSAPGKITFTVLDAGTPVAGAIVHFLGRKAVTSSKGIASISVPRNTSHGTHEAAAVKGGYTSARLAVKVT